MKKASLLALAMISAACGGSSESGDPEGAASELKFGKDVPCQSDNVLKFKGDGSGGWKGDAQFDASDGTFVIFMREPEGGVIGYGSFKTERLPDGTYKLTQHIVSTGGSCAEDECTSNDVAMLEKVGPNKLKVTGAKGDPKKDWGDQSILLTCDESVMKKFK